MEALLTRPAPEMQFSDLYLHLQADSIRWHFSGAAVAIDFLRRLSGVRRRLVRKVIIKEDWKAVSNPECHAKGLVPLLK